MERQVARGARAATNVFICLGVASAERRAEAIMWGVGCVEEGQAGGQGRARR